jgi:hypothetical protein
MALQTDSRLAMNACLCVLFIVELAMDIWSTIISTVACGARGDWSGLGAGCYGCDECYADQQQMQV